jgi:Ca2+:H+ antiporter
MCGAGWFLAGSFETVSQRWGLTYGFLSFIIIPTVINAIDMTETVRLMNQMPTKSNVIISGLLRSIIEMCLFTGPFLVLLAWIMNKPLGFDAYPFEGGVTFISALIVHFIMADARSNWLLGGLIIFLYSILGVAFFFQPDL